MKNNLKRIRIANNITQSDLRKKLHINEASLSRMENGNQRITDEQIIAFADFFNVSTDYLLGREWHDPKTTVYETVDFNIKDVYKKLQAYSKTELIEDRKSVV